MYTYVYTHAHICIWYICHQGEDYGNVNSKPQFAGWKVPFWERHIEVQYGSNTPTHTFKKMCSAVVHLNYANMTLWLLQAYSASVLTWEPCDSHLHNQIQQLSRERAWHVLSHRVVFFIHRKNPEDSKFTQWMMRKETSMKIDVFLIFSYHILISFKTFPSASWNFM